MLASLIRWSIQNRFLVLMGTLLLAAWGVHATLSTPLDALPDLSDTQVIIRTEFAGQAPQVVEDQVTYPLTTTMLSVPGARTVRGYSFFGDSYVYIIFDDKTDLYWARSRVLEYLSQVTGRLPPTAKPLWDLMAPALVGSTSTPSSTTAANTTSPNCARCKIGF
jgi:Cu(I)/Ag(I) efflux system membrane protein CusA/SilA